MESLMEDKNLQSIPYSKEVRAVLVRRGINLGAEDSPLWSVARHREPETADEVQRSLRIEAKLSDLINDRDFLEEVDGIMKLAESLLDSGRITEDQFITLDHAALQSRDREDGKAP